MNASPAEGGLRGATLYLDCYAGIAGDMMLGALLDLGVPQEEVRRALLSLPLSGWRLDVLRVKRGVMMGTKARVVVDAAHSHEQGHSHDHEAAHSHDHAHSHDPAHLHDHHAPRSHEPAHSHDHDAPHSHDHGEHPHVHYADIRAMIVGAGLPQDVVDRALQIFDRIAVVEAEIHGVPVAEVTFHEVGAVDSIIDIVGTAAALSWLRPLRVVSRPVPLGGGMVRTAHGLLPVPAPATLALLRGADVTPGGAEVELTTPTGAAILAAVVERYGPMPAMRVLGAGLGAGDRELPDRPNLLRVVAGVEPAHGVEPGETAGVGDCLVIEANLDDMNPELCEPLMEALFAAGARDVWIAPAHMKKNRPGFVVSALCDPQKEDAVATALLRESTTLGVRRHPVRRTVLDRQVVQVETTYGQVAVKLGSRGGEVWNVAPEYESCKQRAKEHGVPVKQVYAAALAGYQRP
jgi:uncharacterized protein (TIGR00299 family) protein